MNFYPLLNKNTNMCSLPLTHTEEKIQNLASMEKEKNINQNTKSLTKQDLFNDMNKLKSSGVEGDDAFIMSEVLKYYKEKGITIEGVDIDTELKSLETESIGNNQISQPNHEENSEEKKGFIKKTWDGLGKLGDSIHNFVGSNLSNIPNMLGNAGAFFLGKPVDGIFGLEGNKSLENAFKDTGKDVKSKINEWFSVDEQSGWTKAGEFSSELGSLFIPGGQSKLIAKFPQAANLIKTLGTKIDDIGKHAPTIYKVFKGATEGAIDMAKFNVVDEGDINSEDIKFGAIFGGTIPVAGKVYSGIKNKVSKISDKMMTTQLVNPSDLINLGERFSVLNEGGKLKINDIAKFMKKEELIGTKEQIILKIDKLIESKTAQVENMLSKNMKTYSQADNEIIGKLQKALNEKMKYFTEGAEDLIGSAGNEKVVEKIMDLITKDKLSLSEINAGRKILADDMFNALGDAKAAMSQKGWNNVWKDTSEFLDNMARGFRRLNKDIEIGIAMSKGIQKKEASEAVKKMLGYVITGGTTSGAVSLASGNTDPKTLLKNILIGGTLGFGMNKIVGKINSTEMQTRLGNFLGKFTSNDKSIIEKHIKEGLIDKIPYPVLTKIDDALKMTEKEQYELNISKFFAKELSGSQKIEFGFPSQTLKYSGYGDGIIEIAQSTLSKHPEISETTLKHLYNSIQEPVAIIRAKNGKIINITEIVQDGMPIIIATENTVGPKGNIINNIKSVHQRDFGQLINLFSLGDETFVDTGKLLKLINNKVYEEAVRKGIISIEGQKE